MKKGSVNIPNDTVIDELRNIAALYDEENDELSMAMGCIYALDFNTYMGFGNKIQQELELGNDKDGMLKTSLFSMRRCCNNSG